MKPYWMIRGTKYWLTIFGFVEKNMSGKKPEGFLYHNYILYIFYGFEYNIQKKTVVLLYCQWIFCGFITWDTLYTSKFNIWAYSRSLLQVFSHTREPLERSLLLHNNQIVIYQLVYTSKDKYDKLASGWLETNCLEFTL